MPSSDDDLVARAQAGLPYNTDAYETLMRRYETTIYQVCRRWVGHEEDAQDAAQDVMVRVFHHLRGFEARSTFRTWLFTIIINVCRTHLKKRLQQHERFTPELAQERGDNTDMRGTDARLDIERLLEQLSDRDREILVLRFVGDLPLSEIASLLGTTLSATKMRLYRAMERIQELSS